MSSFLKQSPVAISQINIYRHRMAIYSYRSPENQVEVKIAQKHLRLEHLVQTQLDVKYEICSVIWLSQMVRQSGLLQATLKFFGEKPNLPLCKVEMMNYKLLPKICVLVSGLMICKNYSYSKRPSRIMLCHKCTTQYADEIYSKRTVTC